MLTAIKSIILFTRNLVATAGRESVLTTRRRCFFLVAVAPVLAISAVSAAGDEVEQKDELEQKLAEICKSHDVPGMIAASIGPDGIIESACTGVRKRGTDDAITMDDQFALGSSSKSFTATLAAVLVDEGTISWSTPISEIWPNKQVHAALKDVTLEQLLSHTGGLQKDLPNNADWRSFFEEKKKPDEERARMCQLILKKPPKGTAGKHEYSNLGYVVAAAMLEKRGKKPFEQLMKDLVFVPLEMKNTEFYSAKTLLRTKTPLIWGHKMDNGESIRPGTLGSENPTVYASCGTIRTTIGDWARYVRWHMKETAGPVLKKDETLRHLHDDGSNRGVPGQSYGCGWIQFQSQFGRTLQHAGNNTNQYSLVWVMPDTERATIVVTNTGQEQAFKACDAATAFLMMRPKFK